MHDRAISVRDVTLVTEPGELEAALKTIARLTEFYAQSGALMDRMFAERADVTTEEREILALIKETERKTLPLIDGVIAAQRAGDVSAAKALLMQQARPAFIEWLSRINRFIDLEEKMNRTIADVVRGVANGFQMLMTSLCGIALAIGAAFAWWTIRSTPKVTSPSPKPTCERQNCFVFSRRRLVACHHSDLAAARACGLQTAYVDRPKEYGGAPAPDRSYEQEWEWRANDFMELAQLFGPK